MSIMNALLFDDRPDMRGTLENHLALFGVSDVTSCRSCRQAIKALEAQLPCFFERYILDLSVPSQGLPKTMQAATASGLRTGWVLLTQVIYPQDNACMQRTIIFSDYLDKLKTYIRGASDQEKLWYNQLKDRNALVSKMEGGLSALDRLLKQV